MQPSMRKKGVVFSDVDGTLCFHQDAHGIREIERHPDGIVLVEEPLSGRRHPSVDVSTTHSGNIYLAVRTRELALQVRQQYDFVFVTGARPSTIHARRHAFDFADGIILESGAVILDAALEPDPVWASRMQPEIAYLAEVAESIRAMGWILDVAGRTSALRIRRRDNLHKSDREFEALRRDLPVPPALKKTMNLDSLDVILDSAGKDKAVRYWLEAHAYTTAQSIGIGDDINDLEFLEVIGKPYMLASAYPEALQRAREKGWTISRSPHFDGIDEILQAILEL